MPYREIEPGDEIFVRGRALQVVHGPFGGVQVEVSDYPNFVSSQWVPVSECAKVEDICRLLPRKNRA